jgi:hypothetical protein
MEKLLRYGKEWAHHGARKGKTPRKFIPEQTVNILRERLIERVPVDYVCDKHQIHQTLFDQRQKTFFKKRRAAFEDGHSACRVVGIKSLSSRLWKASSECARKP